MRSVLFILYSCVFGLAVLFGTTLAQTIEPKPPDPLHVRIAKECQPEGKDCFIVPPAAIQELEERFTNLKAKIKERDAVIKELQEYQSKTCI